jgi:gluconate 2-dehydrogenase gamma chain
MFPKTKSFVGASNLNLLQFIKKLSIEKNPDREIIDFLVNGAKKLYGYNTHYLQLSHQEKESLLREFEQANQQWLSTLLYYGLEGMLGDPIYGGNNQMLGWKNISHTPGLPRPTMRYGKSHV